MDRKVGVRIVSDGSLTGTHVYDAKSGNELHGIISITWEADAARGTRAFIETVVSSIDVSVDGKDVVLHPKFDEGKEHGNSN